jgi:glycerol-3-phosphate acyltransferase PlsY
MAVNWPADGPFLLAALVVGYLLGTLPFGLLLTRLAGLGDIRRVGSGNIGATNVLRTGNKGLAAATLAGDALKGTAAVLVGAAHSPTAAILGALGAFLGHLFPVWLGFKGGKGVATFLGCLLGLKALAALGFAAIWLAAAFLTRYSSASALLASAATPVILLILGEPSMAALFACLAALLWWKHRENVRRLLDGSEGKIGQTSGTPSAKAAP